MHFIASWPYQPVACLFAIIAAGAPRLAFLLLWAFTPLVSQAFNTFIFPLLGVIFLPFTTPVYVLVYIPGSGLAG